MLNLAIYITLCTTSIFVGKGIFRIIGINTKANFIIFISPIVTLSFWTLFLTMVIISGFSVQKSWLIGWLLTLFFAMLGIQREYIQLLIKNWLLLFSSLIMPALIMLPYLLHGISNYLGHWQSWDGWNYIVLGQYFWEHPKGGHESLTPFYQYTSIGTNLRFISSALLAFFSPLTGHLGDTQASSGYFLLYTLFVYSSSCFAFASVFFKDHDKKIILFYTFLCTFSGVILNLIICNNYDNLLAISYFPAIACIILFIGHKERSWAIILGLLTASAIYIYIEIAPFLLMSIFLFSTYQLLYDKTNRKELLLTFLVSAIICIILLSPWSHQAYSFFKGQLNHAMTTKPGLGNFAQLFHTPCFIGALWGFWAPDEACYPSYYLSIENILGIVLTFLFLAGVYHLCKKKKWAVIFNVVIFTTALLYFLFYYRYNYGAFKIIALSWWLICISLIYGIQLAPKFLNDRTKKILIIVLSLIILVMIGNRIVRLNNTDIPNSIKAYKQIPKIKPIVTNQELHIKLSNTLATAWAFYYLRDLNPFFDYCSHPYLNFSNTNNKNTAHFSNNTFIVTDNDIISSKKAIKLTPEWHGRLYYLYSIRNSNWAMINSITNPNGLEKWNNSDGFWIGGDKETVIDLQTGKKGILTMTANLIPGPSLPQTNNRKFLIKNNTGYEKVVNVTLPLLLRLTIPTKTGNNIITISSLDKATTIIPADKRVMLIGVQDLALTDFK